MGDKFKKEQELFEVWFKRQFPNDYKEELKKEKDHSYKELTTEAMYIGFCAAYLIYG